MKQHGDFFGIFAFGLLLLKEFSAQSAVSVGDSPATGLQNAGAESITTLLPKLRRLAAFSFGAVVPYALTCLILWRAGVFDKFWQWTVVYASGHALRYSFQNLAWYFQSIGPYNFFWAMA